MTPQLDSIGFEHPRNRSRVARFSAGQPSNVQIDQADLLTSMIAILFGAVHCLGWTFHFPSDTEQLLWRIASMITTASPIVWAVVYALSLTDDLEKCPGKRIRSSTITHITAIIVPIYLVARTILLVVAVISLRSLPHAAYKTVYWTTFIPHV